MNSYLNPAISKNLAYPHPVKPTTQAVPSVNSTGPLQSMFAHSFEFVAKPNEAQRLQAAIPSALTGILKDVTGFAGCLVLVASLEARLVNVVTLWRGTDSHKRCAENVRWIQTIVAPYMEHRLRLQTYLASVPEILTQSRATTAAAESFIEEDVRPYSEEVCLG